jgi:uncharacterized protein YcfJ
MFEGVIMKTARTLSILAVAFAAVACGGDSKIDDALNNDLSLASQARPFNPLDSISAAERNQAELQTAAPRRSTARPVTYTTTRVYSAPAPREPEYRVVKNTKRDAAIGAGAGAIIGAATSRDKVKGGLIGAAAGGLIGAIIGNNVDKKKVPVNR